MNPLNFLTKVTSKRRWIPVAICCIPAVLLAVGVGVTSLGNLARNTVGANSIFLIITGLACPIGMGLMMWLMNKNMSHPQQHLTPQSNEKDTSAASRLAELREQREILDAEIAEMTRIAELEEQHDALLIVAPSPGD